jgi:hypothetical protein
MQVRVLREMLIREAENISVILLPCRMIGLKSQVITDMLMHV